MQLAFNRSLISVDERNRVFRVMKSLQLPFWHPVCCTKLFYKVSWRELLRSGWPYPLQSYIAAVR